MEVPHKHFLRTELTNAWHCTSTTGLYRIFYFAMNDETKQWLFSYKLLSKLPLEDIAFYKDGEVLFGACTHEKFYYARQYKDEINQCETPERADIFKEEIRIANEKRNAKWVQSEAEWQKEEPKKAQDFFELAEQGYTDAQYFVAMCYGGKQAKYAAQFPLDEKKAAEFYLKAAENGHTRSLYEAGCCYFDGRGVEQDYEKAAELLLNCLEVIKPIESNKRLSLAIQKEMGWDDGVSAAIDAKFRLALCYLKGLGVEQDYEKAIACFLEIENISGDAMLELARCYENGLGVEKDIKKAFSLYEKAYYFGVTEGASYLGHCYKNGINTEQDYNKAAYWFDLAALNDCEQSKKELEELKKLANK